MIKICCVCNRIKHRGTWIAAEVFDEKEQLSHGYCPTCYDSVLEDISLFLHKEEKDLAMLAPQIVSASECVGVCA